MADLNVGFYQIKNASYGFIDVDFDAIDKQVTSLVKVDERGIAGIFNVTLAPGDTFAVSLIAPYVKMQRETKLKDGEIISQIPDTKNVDQERWYITKVHAGLFTISHKKSSDFWFFSEDRRQVACGNSDPPGPSWYWEFTRVPSMTIAGGLTPGKYKIKNTQYGHINSDANPEHGGNRPVITSSEAAIWEIQQASPFVDASPGHRCPYTHLEKCCCDNCCANGATWRIFFVMSDQDYELIGSDSRQSADVDKERNVVLQPEASVRTPEWHIVEDSSASKVYKIVSATDTDSKAHWTLASSDPSTQVFFHDKLPDSENLCCLWEFIPV